MKTGNDKNIKLVQFQPKDIEVLQRQTVFDGFFKMVKYSFKHRLFSGGWSPVIEREMFERGTASALLAYDDQHDSVVLVEQIRVGALESKAPWQLEIIAGMDDGDAPEKVVCKEAQEEAGIDQVDNLQQICQFYSSSGGSSEKLAIFVGKIDSTKVKGIHGVADEGEDIKVHVLSRDDAYQLVKSGVIENATTIIALQWLELNYLELKQAWQD